jgi:hypothetical protein
MTSKENVASFFFPNFDTAASNPNELDTDIGPLVKGSPQRFRRLSPFTAPQQVLVYVTGPDAIAFHFIYANEEPAESTPRTVEMTNNIAVNLGRYTKKILAVVISAGAHDIVRKGSVPFPSSAAQQWIGEVTHSSYFACTRNAEVVSSILQNIPSSVQTALSTTLEKMTYQKALSDLHGH